MTWPRPDSSFAAFLERNGLSLRGRIVVTNASKPASLENKAFFVLVTDDVAHKLDIMVWAKRYHAAMNSISVYREGQRVGRVYGFDELVPATEFKLRFG